MTLTAAQYVTLKAAIDADPTLSAFPPTADGSQGIADLLNAPASPDFLLWRTDAPVSGILDAIDWTRYTPSDAADNTATWTNRVLASQTKQINLQLMLQGRDTIDTTKANVRAGLRDAVTQLPTGAAGATTNPGGTNGTTVLSACTRKATRAEKIFAVGSATTGAVTANFATWTGELFYQDVSNARGV